MDNSSEFSDISVDISIADQEILIDWYVNNKLDPASISLYYSTDSNSVAEALYKAVLNEVALEAIKKNIKNP